MGADLSKIFAAPSPTASTASKSEEPADKKKPLPSSRSQQYHDVKNPKYVEEEQQKTLSSSSSTSHSSESSSLSAESDEKQREVKSVPRKAVKTKEPTTPAPAPPPPIVNPLKSLKGLTGKAKVKKSEEMLHKMWKHPHPSWEKISDVTSITTEKANIDGQVSDDVRKRVNYTADKKVYDIPLERCHLRVPKNRASRSCPDPWRRHGAHVKLCQVGGIMPENRNRNAKSIPVRKGTIPPPDPKTKPLLVMEDYMKLIRK